MSWAKLLQDDRVRKERTSKTEIDNLRSIVARCLSDVTAQGLSADARFVHAYDAARTLSLIVVRAEGYRPTSTRGHHYNTFLALETAEPRFMKMSAYFDGCRSKRNILEYDFAGGVTETEAVALLKAVKEFAVEVEAWIAAHRPALA